MVPFTQVEKNQRLHPITNKHRHSINSNYFVITRYGILYKSVSKFIHAVSLHHCLVEYYPTRFHQT